MFSRTPGSCKKFLYFSGTLSFQTLKRTFFKPKIELTSSFSNSLKTFSYSISHKNLSGPVGDFTLNGSSVGLSITTLSPLFAPEFNDEQPSLHHRVYLDFLHLSHQDPPKLTFFFSDRMRIQKLQTPVIGHYNIYLTCKKKETRHQYTVTKG